MTFSLLVFGCCRSNARRSAAAAELTAATRLASPRPPSAEAAPLGSTDPVSTPRAGGASCCKANDFKFRRRVHPRENLPHASIDWILDRGLATVVALEHREVLQDDNAVLGNPER